MTLSNRKVPYKLRLHTCKVRLKDLKKIKMTFLINLKLLLKA